MFHIIFGLFFLAIGFLGLYDFYYYVVDLIKGGLPVCLLLFGSVAILAAVMPRIIKENADHD